MLKKDTESAELVEAIKKLAMVDNENTFKTVVTELVEQRKEHLKYEINVFYENRLPYLIRQAMDEVRRIIEKQLECEPFDPSIRKSQDVLHLLCNALEAMPTKGLSNSES